MDMGTAETEEMIRRRKEAAYQRQLRLSMPEVRRDPCLESEGMGRGKVCYYDGRLYYVNGEYLCSSDQYGENIKILAKEVRGDCDGLSVNATGIYMRDNDAKEERVFITHFDFDGRQVGRQVLLGLQRQICEGV